MCDNKETDFLDKNDVSVEQKMYCRQIHRWVLLYREVLRDVIYVKKNI